MITVSRINGQSDLDKAFEIRRIVFVEEQNVAPEEEYDEFEDSSVHFLALLNNEPAGTARYRQTDKGYKLERFAVLKEARGYGVGALLVKSCLEALDPQPYIYLHAQEHALGFYEKLGFSPVGERFWECEIPHFKMVKTKE